MTTSTDSAMNQLLTGLSAGDPAALEGLLATYRPRLQKLVFLFLDRRAEHLVSQADLLNEARDDMQDQLSDFAANPVLPPFLWMRKVMLERIRRVNVEYADTDESRQSPEVSLCRGRWPLATSVSLVSQLLGEKATEDDAAVRAGRQLKLQAALNALEETDRDILVMRHFEQLSPEEVATVLDVDPSAAGSLYLRALQKLNQELAS